MSSGSRHWNESPGRVVRDREREGVRLHVVPTLQHRRREDQDLVGDRERGEHSRAADDDPVGGLADEPEGDERIVELARRLRSVDLRVGEGVGECEIVIADVMEVGERVGPKPWVALCEVVTGHAGGHHVDVEVVGGAAHEAERGVGPHLVHRRPAGEVVLRRRHDEAQTGALARRRLDIGHHVDEVGAVLQVVQPGERLGDVGGARVRGRIGDQLALDPQRRGSLLQAGQDLMTGSCSHGCESRGSGSFDHTRRRLAVDDELQDVGSRVVPGGVADRLRFTNLIE